MHGTAKAGKKSFENRWDKKAVEMYVCHKCQHFEGFFFMKSSAGGKKWINFDWIFY